MYIDSLNLRRTVPNCPQLTPAITLSGVPTVFDYTVLHYTSTTSEANNIRTLHFL